MKKKKGNEEYLALFGFISALSILIIHYFLLSKFNIHPTIHVALGLLMFFLFSALLSSILQKFGSKIF